jgi:hypothetical protein
MFTKGWHLFRSEARLFAASGALSSALNGKLKTSLAPAASGRTDRVTRVS